MYNRVAEKNEGIERGRERERGNERARSLDQLRDWMFTEDFFPQNFVDDDSSHFRASRAKFSYQSLLHHTPEI